MPKISAKQKLQNKQLFTKQLLAKKQPKQQISEDIIRVDELVQVFEAALRIYKHKPFLKFRKGMVKETDHNYKTWLRAVSFADELGVDFVTYVTAQFHYFDKNFNRAPKVFELASFRTTVNAKERVRLYQASHAAPMKVFGPLVNNSKYVPVAKLDESAAHASEMSLKTLMTNYKRSEEEIMRVFGKPEVCGIYFDEKWLNQNSTYVRLKQLGEI